MTPLFCKIFLDIIITEFKKRKLITIKLINKSLFYNEISKIFFAYKLITNV